MPKKPMCGKCGKRVVVAKGKCRSCYNYSTHKRRMDTDSAYAERHRKLTREKVKRHYARKKKQNPSHGAIRSKKYREQHPAEFNFSLAKHYIKKLTPEKREELLKKTK